MKKIFIKTVSIVALVICMFSTLGVAQPNNETRVESWVIEGLTTHVETFNHTKKVKVAEIFVNNMFNFPDYNYSGKYSNSGGLCGPIAGMNLIGYYDGVYNELIPNFNSLATSKAYVYGSSSTNPVGDELYSLMKTNQSGSGTSVSNLKSGFTSYVQSKGLKVKSESSEIFFGLFFSSNKYISHIKQNKPVVVITNNCDYVDASNLLTRGNTESIITQRISKPHASIANGYVKYEYYRNEQVSVWSPVWYNPLRFVTETREVNFRTDEYLAVSFGDGTQGFMNIANSKITDAFTLEVYR